MRGFPAQQLIEVESELASAAFWCDQLAFDVGDMADEVHFDGAPLKDAAAWLNDLTKLRMKLDRAEGLLKAYELFRKANEGEGDDDACAG